MKTEHVFILGGVLAVGAAAFWYYHQKAVPPAPLALSNPQQRDSGNNNVAATITAGTDAIDRIGKIIGGW